MSITQLGSPQRPIRVGTRASQLARTQTEQVVAELQERAMCCEIVEITTEGDRAPGSLSSFSGVGVFAAALRIALLENRCDLAVHSYKDLPTTTVPGLEIACVPKRAPWNDVLVSAQNLRLDQLAPGALVGTGSPRRIAQLRALRPDLNYVDIRGNIGTRIARVHDLASGSKADLDAVVLARAGLSRLGAEKWVSQDLNELLPAPGQGALALECRSEDLRSAYARQFALTLRLVNDPSAQLAVEAERAVLRHLEAGCAAPLAALGQLQWAAGGAGQVRGSNVGQLSLSALVISLDGTKRIELSADTLLPLGISQVESDYALSMAQELGVQLGEELLAEGAGQITDLSAKKALRSPFDQTREAGEALPQPGLWPDGTSNPLDVDHKLS